MRIQNSGGEPRLACRTPSTLSTTRSMTRIDNHWAKCNQELLTGTCIQIAANHYSPNELVAGSHMFRLRNDLNDALSRKPTKHGILGFDLYSEWGPMATARGLPYIETGLSPTAKSDFSKAFMDRLGQGTRADISWLMPGLLKRVLPERFAVMLDQGTAAEMGKTIGLNANRFNKTIALQSAVPLQDLEDRAGLAVRYLFREMIQGMHPVLLHQAPFLNPRAIREHVTEFTFEPFNGSAMYVGFKPCSRFKRLVAPRWHHCG